MEVHESDPKRDAEPDPWDEVGSHFGELGERMRSTYRRVADERGPSEEEIRGAFSTLVGAWDQVAESLSDILRDPDTREDLKKAAGALAGALGSTLSKLGTEFGVNDEGSKEEEE
ncbi:MAG: hypothetical protein DWQ40_05690 [Actinobacteria bacterium]|nr:MAG: hypothetical protein DWQ40_05690 [Actinomycetota bacterium]